MKLSAFLLLILTLAVNGADRNLRGGDEERDLEEGEGPMMTITSGYYDFKAKIEITLELVNGGCHRNLKNIGNQGQQAKAELAAEQEAEQEAKEAQIICEVYFDCGDDEDAFYPSATIDAVENVKGKAFGIGALTALNRALKRKITLDKGPMEGIEAFNSTVTMQEIVDVKSENNNENGRHLSWSGSYVRSYMRIIGNCNSHCGRDNQDQRSLEIMNRRKLLADDPESLNKACSALAEKIMLAAGQGHELLSNIDRIGLTMIAPGPHLTDPITC